MFLSDFHDKKNIWYLDNRRQNSGIESVICSMCPLATKYFWFYMSYRMQKEVVGYLKLSFIWKLERFLLISLEHLWLYASHLYCIYIWKLYEIKQNTNIRNIDTLLYSLCLNYRKALEYIESMRYKVINMYIRYLDNRRENAGIDGVICSMCALVTK